MLDSRLPRLSQDKILEFLNEKNIPGLQLVRKRGEYSEKAADYILYPFLPQELTDKIKAIVSGTVKTNE